MEQKGLSTPLHDCPTVYAGIFMTRRSFLSRTAALASAPSALPAGARRPNILVILLDDLGFGQFGPNGDMFDLNQITPIVLERDRGSVQREAAAAAAKQAVNHLQ